MPSRPVGMPLGDVPSGPRTSSPSTRRFVATTFGLVRSRQVSSKVSSKVSSGLVKGVVKGVVAAGGAHVAAGDAGAVVVTLAADDEPGRRGDRGDRGDRGASRLGTAIRQGLLLRIRMALALLGRVCASC